LHVKSIGFFRRPGVDFPRHLMTRLFSSLGICLFVWFCFLVAPASSLKAETPTEGPDVGFAYDDFDLTLETGHRTEIGGPFYYREQLETSRIWAVPPILSYCEEKTTDLVEFSFMYPLFTYVRYGDQSRWQFFQLLNFVNGPNLDEKVRQRFTIFPLYFHQKSSDPSQEYVGYGPFYGHLYNRIFRDEIEYVMFPFYSKTRKKDVVTRNYVYPFFHLRDGDGLEGWQLWPIWGEQRKGLTTRTNGFGDVEMVGGHYQLFILWPFFGNQWTGLGTDNPQWQQVLFPFYNIFRSPLRDSTTILWPFFTTINDREKGYREWQYPWPFITFARGEKTINRFWPIYSQASNTNQISNTYLWPVFKYNRIMSSPIDRERRRILFYLFSDIIEKDTVRHLYKRRTDFWPLFTNRRDRDGSTRLQILAPIETILPENHLIERQYSPFWSIWRSENNPKAGKSSQSLFWNLYRHEVTPQSRKVSCFFGLFKSETTEGVTHTRLFYIPLR
jgi:hypothetical protein